MDVGRGRVSLVMNPLFTLVPDLRLACSSPVGMALVAQTCTWAARWWRRPRNECAKTMSLIEGAAEEGMIPMIKYLVADVPYREAALTRCMIRAMQCGSPRVFCACDILMMGFPTDFTFFACWCAAADERRLFLSRALDILDWDADLRKTLMARLLRVAVNDVDVWLHVSGDPDYALYDEASRVTLRTKDITVATVRDWHANHVDLIMEQVPLASRAEARECLIKAGGDIVNAIMELADYVPLRDYDNPSGAALPLLYTGK